MSLFYKFRREVYFGASLGFWVLVTVKDLIYVAVIKKPYYLLWIPIDPYFGNLI